MLETIIRLEVDSDGMTAKRGSEVAIWTWSDECTALSSDSITNAMETPPTNPSNSETRRMCDMFGFTGVIETEAGSTIWMLLDLNPVMTPASFDFCERLS